MQYTCRSWSSASDSHGSGCIAKVGQNLENSTTVLDAQALARLKNRLSSNIGRAQLAAPIAESREIHRIVRQINTLGIDTVKALLNLKRSRGKSLLKHAGDIWLGFGFGIAPMIKDIEAGANAILDYQTREDRLVVVHGSATQEYQSQQTEAIQNAVQIAWGMGLAFAMSTHHTQGIRYVAGIDLKIGSASSYSVGEHLGLTVSALPSTLWELTPFSWVVDYFTTVGPWLDDMFYTIPGNTVYVSKNYKYQNETIGLPLIYNINGGGFTHSFNGDRWIVKHVKFSRSKLTSLPVLPLRIKSVDEVASHGLTKLLNLASVLAGRHGGANLNQKPD